MKAERSEAVRIRRRRERGIANMLFVAFCFFATLLALGMLALILGSLMKKGVPGLHFQVFALSTPAPGSEGGLMNAIAGTLIMCALAMLFSVVIGVLAGTWLAEYGGTAPLARAVRFINDMLLSAPSILVGLFVYQVLVAPFHGFSAFAGAAALSLIAIPIVTRTTEDILALQPATLREAGLALGTPLWATIRHILWSAGRGGIITGALLAFARISGETAPLLFTALNNQFFNIDPTQPMSSLPAVIFQFAMSAYDDWRQLAWTGTLLIAAMVLATSIIARLLSRKPVK